ncbi:adenylosuccinate lyase [Candidatus Altiarchaeales archaeon WOR_SM1_SCG]|nr:adenylosuccinate lyase [Candidatus Altiarchaeales archaeon WOR_SM1_SCG]
MIHPIEGRYGKKEVKDIFEEENKLQKILEVEAALARAHAEVGNIPKKAADIISKKVKEKVVTVLRVSEIEEEINHDLMAMVKALSEQCGDDAGKYIHLGATSNDIQDTALALQLKEYIKYLECDLQNLKKILLKLSGEHKKTVCIGRTHAQHAVPTTYGLKFAIYACEVQRHIDRLGEYKKRILVGQMTGAVGTQAALGKHAVKIQKLIMKDLGLDPVLVSNQVIQRDRHAEFLLNLALISETLNKIATEIRNLQRTEIDEVSEGFGKKQVGSSTMPHKRNPIIAERICGLSRIIRADAFAAMDNIPLWHERDLTNSSPERILIPESCILTDYILNLTIDLLTNLVFKHENIKRNLMMSETIMAESIMIELFDKGMGRQNAHELVRECAMESYKSDKTFKEILTENEQVRAYLSKGEIWDALNPVHYIGTAVEQVENVIKKLG